MIRVDVAVGEQFEVIGDKLKAAGKEDESGARRYVLERLRLCDYKAVMSYLNLTLPEAKALRVACCTEAAADE